MAQTIKMQSMELDDDDKLDACTPMPCEKPDFPYGLRISLTEKELSKMGLDPAEATTGGLVHGHFMGRITSVSTEQRDGEDRCRVEIQIEDLAIESEDLENAAAENDATAKTTRRKSVLYG